MRARIQKRDAALERRPLSLKEKSMSRGLTVVSALVAGALLFAGPLLAQVQSQPLPPPAGTPPASTPPAASPPAATPPASKPAPTTSTKADSPKTPTPLTKPAPKAGTQNTCPDQKVDINDASAETLRTLPQIGVQRSNAIVKARPYATPEDLMKKKVLKKAVYEKIKSCITASGVEPAAPAPKRPAPKAGTATKPPAPSTPTSPVPVPAPTSTESQPAPKQ